MKLGLLGTGGRKVGSALAVLLCSALFSAFAVSGALGAGKLESDSDRPYVHRISLYATDGSIIDPHRDSPLPFSNEMTCGKCHDHSSIEGGWHFNAKDPGKDDGRPGEPWILVDEATGTQIPLSYRDWEGLWNPADLGMSDWEFLKEFGRHLPSGVGLGPNPHDLEEIESQWETAGELEISCMVCHDIDGTYDIAERAKQINRDNHEYVSVVATGLAIARGSVTELAAEKASSASVDDIFASFDPAAEDDDLPADKVLLELTYALQQFDDDNRTVLQLRKHMPSENCFACHTQHPVASTGEAPVGDMHDAVGWDKDVHLVAGMECIACHRNDIDHDMVRGYEGEKIGDIARETLTCQGCHYGVAENESENTLAMGGRQGAPYPHHAGLPPVHLEILSCTSCHSGTYPREDQVMLQTSMAHALSIATHDRTEDSLPLIQSPIYLPGFDGKLAPHRVLWPSFFGAVGENDIRPLLPSRLRSVLKSAKDDEIERSKEQLAAQLSELNNSDEFDEEEVVYVTGGMVHRLSESNEIESSASDLAKPYAWAIGHNVRSASQSLGVISCQECHSSDAPFLFSNVASINTFTDLQSLSSEMIEFTGLDRDYNLRFAASFAFRPIFKLYLVFAVLLLTLGFIVYASRVLHVSMKTGLPEDRT